ncbi:MAG: nitrous oxide reductase accessory protein NosL [Candidatus Solibacter sp.]|nr:nitrous oxide reductase accessory protein NosL [Candidatus Solibacter sp.]
MKRRDLIKTSLATAAAGALASTALRAQQAGGMSGMPTQAVAKKPADPEPQVNDIEKYPKCNYCGMDRARFHHSRMLLHYSDGLAEGVCSIRCAATSLTINVGRGTKAIWVGDNASPAEVKPLVDAEKASFLVGSSIRGVMTRRSKVAYSTTEAAEASRVANGGEIFDFDKALLAAFTDIAESVATSRKTREERLKRAQEKQDK